MKRVIYIFKCAILIGHDKWIKIFNRSPIIWNIKISILSFGFFSKFNRQRENQDRWVRTIFLFWNFFFSIVFSLLKKPIMCHKRNLRSIKVCDYLFRNDLALFYFLNISINVTIFYLNDSSFRAFNKVYKQIRSVLRFIT